MYFLSTFILHFRLYTYDVSYVSKYEENMFYH